MERDRWVRATRQALSISRGFTCWGIESNAAVYDAYGEGGAAGSRECGYRPDGAETIPESTDAGRIRAHPVLRLAVPARGEAESRIRAEFRPLQRRVDSADAREFRLRVKPGARTLGREGLRLPGDPGTELRRHFLQQLLQERHFARGAERRTDRATVSADGERRGLLSDRRSPESDGAGF